MEEGRKPIARLLLHALGLLSVLLPAAIVAPILLVSRSYSGWNSETNGKVLYSQPGNTLQVLYIVASSVSVGLSPISLYEKLRIDAFAFGSRHQPLLAPYYVLKEAHRLHPDLLKTLVLDPSVDRSTFCIINDSKYTSDLVSDGYNKIARWVWETCFIRYHALMHATVLQRLWRYNLICRSSQSLS